MLIYLKFFVLYVNNVTIICTQ